MVADSKSGDSYKSYVRTSSGFFLQKGQDATIRRIENRIATWTFLPKENGESIHVLHYAIGEKYDPHFDYFKDEKNLARGGHRMATVLMYLSDVVKGGETFFPNAEGIDQHKDDSWSDCSKGSFAVKPKKGDAVLFFSLHPDATTDTASLHGSCPVIEGEKWAATCWIHIRNFKSVKDSKEESIEEKEVDLISVEESSAVEGTREKRKYNRSYSCMRKTAKSNCNVNGHRRVLVFSHPELQSVLHSGRFNHSMIDTSRWGMTTAAIGNMKLKFALLVLCFAAAAATNDLITQRCSSSDNFTSGSTFHRNLNAVLTSLTANSIPTGFNATISGDSPDVVYGLALCRGDLTSGDCQTCVSNSATQLVILCPTTRDAIIWYEYCELRYSYTKFFGVVDKGPRVDWRWVNHNVTNITLFNNRLGVLLDNLTSMATSDPSALMFATGAIHLSDVQKIYGLVQCTRDLKLEDCKSCLDDVIGYIPKCCGGTEGAQVLRGSCNVRFDTDNFYFPNRPAPNPTPAPNPPDSSSASPKDSNPPRRNPYIIPISISIPLAFFVSVAAYITWYWKRPHPQTGKSAILTVESLLFDFCSIETATDNFSDANKLGQGGYGPVYKGKLPNGQEIAVKRLSASSGQGATEFKNEVLLAAKLQHRNLVRILGCCLERQEKMLIYQYVPNSSLDKFLFDPMKRELLDWGTSFNIITGIARGLLYLHEESQLKVIHRDLKPSNILLDETMIPKIADFGMARIFGLDQTESNTNRIAGTYGYMSPEYAMYGIISEKSDVFSFGIIVLEILTGRKTTFTQPYTTEEDLLDHSWKLWRENRALELVNYKLATSGERNEALRCIRVGLLCVQEDPAARPTMSSIILMLCNASVTFPLPSPPALFGQRSNVSSNIRPVSQIDCTSSDQHHG